ncbi:MAG: MotA/TolQ/ExbB proton channel family protein [Bdellovibrionaceae bacterium]|nr:MotA/TolQ/ExbB proton channel family protein [Pseudobdellovibrionaceae bacterium]
MEAIIMITDVVEKLILTIMFGLSIWSISIMLDRRKNLNSLISTDEFQKIKNLLTDNGAHFSPQKIETLKKYVSGQNTYLSRAFQNVLAAPVQPEAIDRVTQAYVREERLKLERGLAVLATLGANAPFIGLFGTVLGIIRAFAYLGSQSGSSAVMSGVSQALYATALGLFVAIPAIIAFNVFTQNIRKLNSQLDTLKDLYVAQVVGRTEVR